MVDIAEMVDVVGHICIQGEERRRGLWKYQPSISNTSTSRIHERSDGI
jgi:hypothetical protein